MITPLAQKIAEVIDTCIHSEEGHAIWRDMIEGEQWKIVVDYDGNTEKFNIIVKRRDNFGTREGEE